MFRQLAKLAKPTKAVSRFGDDLAENAPTRALEGSTTPSLAEQTAEALPLEKTPQSTIAKEHERVMAIFNDSPPVEEAPTPPVREKAPQGERVIESYVTDKNRMVEIRDPIDFKQSGAYLSGDLKESGAANRNNALANVRKHREDVYATLMAREPEKMSQYDAPVLAVLQGEFRDKFGRELWPTSPKDKKEMFKLANSLQKKYDVLKQKYKDTPDIELFHGNEPHKIAGTQLRGFNVPSLSRRNGQQELDMAAPSMTGDLNLNMRQDQFGGKDVDSYVSYKMPYAEYKFMRVNVPDTSGGGDNYNKNLNLAARAITGVPGKVRPLGISRKGGFAETEDSMVEADRMFAKLDTGSPELKNKILTAAKNVTDTDRKINKIENELTKLNDNGISNKKEAFQAYSLIRKKMAALSEYTKNVSTKKGTGMYYEQDFASAMYQPGGIDLDDLAVKMNMFGAKEKARNLVELKFAVRDASSHIFPGAGGRAINLIDKFNKGGLVKRR